MYYYTVYFRKVYWKLIFIQKDIVVLYLKDKKHIFGNMMSLIYQSEKHLVRVQ